MSAFLFDTTVFLYAVGSDHPYREPCRHVVALATDGALEGHASVELVHEFAHVRLRRTGDHELALADARDVAALCRLHDFERRDLDLALELGGRHRLRDFRDAVFAATAFNRGMATILSADRDFETIDGLRRIDPADRGGVDALREAP